MKPQSEIIAASVPPIIDPAVFAAVQARLRENNARVTPPRIVTGPVLLTGIAVCASCSGAMTLRTGTSCTGRMYRYYTCSSCARAGQVKCRGRSIQMDKLDSLVKTSHAVRLASERPGSAQLSTRSKSMITRSVSRARRRRLNRRFSPRRKTTLREFAVLFAIGAPDEIRTHDLCLRRAALYPAELRVPTGAASRADGAS
jgi:hypothetical protein